MKYRIMIETEASGKKWYYPQRKGYLFWKHLFTTPFGNRLGHTTLEEAQNCISCHIEQIHNEQQKKIVKREYQKYNEQD